MTYVQLLAGWSLALAQAPEPSRPPPAEPPAQPPAKANPPARKIDRPPTPPDPEATTKAFARDYLDPLECDRRFGAEVAELIRRGGTVTAERVRADAFANRRWGGAFAPARGSAAGTRLEPEALYRKAKESVVILAGLHQCGACPDWHPKSATGFVVAPGVVATNAHVLEAFRNEATLVAVTADGKPAPVVAGLAADRHNDVALVRAEGLLAPPLPLADDPEVGATAYCLSHPSIGSRQITNCYFAFTQGMVSGKYRIPSGGRTFDALAVTSDYCKGSSGGPILDARGAAIGMVCTADPVNYEDRGPGRSPQMVWRFVRPASVLKALFDPPAAP